MKKLFTILLILIFIVFGVYFGKKIYEQKKEEHRIEEAKKGWYLEVITDYISVRQEANRTSTKLGEIKKGEIYEVADYYVNKNSNFYWYEIVLKDGSYGWVANTKSGEYLKDYNGRMDVATPTLKYYEEEYKVISIDDINYDHLEVWDDRDDYVITHVVYHEVNKSMNIDQYWIEYTVIDGSGKSVSKIQKITFEKKPSESQVKDFYKK